MNQIGLHEAKTRLSELIAKVCEGEQFTITRRGIPVAYLTPVSIADQDDIEKAIEGLERLRKRCVLGGLNIREMMEEGRR
ncbi:MAG: type II toxin-antitoxin system prevent-host-death family antitoxin [Candidatus Omnitrophota bacterium]|jgi:prevent-host-death family protein|nr:MAG: type II toxin-antitoxin system prevent-host-death family antitoxin [Candidatus Omnitrophota bacterium]